MYPDLKVVGEASDGVETLEQAMALRPDILLLDMAMPNLGGLEVLRRISKDLPDCKVVILTQHEAPAYILPALQAGAKGYLLKKAGGGEVVQAVRAVARGESVLHPSIAKYVIEAAVRGTPEAGQVPPPAALTDREQEVLALIAEGKTNAEIASVLSISPKTVDKHRASLMDKLGVTNRAGLIRYAIENQQ